MENVPLHMVNKALRVSYGFLFFIIPLFFFPRSSELFEFNKIVILYAMTTIITATWIIECIYAKKLIFRRTLLDIPLLLFLSSQLLSTIFSIDPHISIFGYYSRFNGGLISSCSYALLYWCYVTHMNKVDVRKALYVLISATVIASIWGALEHLGRSPSCLFITHNFDVSCWVQDVQLRVYATFGQPNWMAAWIVALTPIAWFFLLEESQLKSKRSFVILLIQTLFFLALLFTKSRSGVIAFALANVFFWFITLIKIYKEKKQRAFAFYSFVSVELLIILSALLVGTPFTPSIFDITQKKAAVVETVVSPALETGGTESGEIRKIVWQGALNVWKEFPLLGSGVETFALSYYRGRPMEHNLVSEWNFLYNKAHNEYLNYLATTGLIGLILYGMLIIATFISMMVKNMDLKSSYHLFTSVSSLNVALSAGFISILVTNFFGFSVVPVSLLFFMFPAFSFAIQSNKQVDSINKTEGANTAQIAALVAVLLTSGFLLFEIMKYWYADYLYARGREAQNGAEYIQSIQYYQSAIATVPTEATYHADLGALYAELAVASAENAESKKTSETFASAALTQIELTTTLSPHNVKLLKSVGNSYSNLGDINSIYIDKTLQITQTLQNLAPTDPSVLYQKTLTLAKLGRIDEAVLTGEKTIQMKTNYKIARRLLAFLYKQQGQKEKAKEQLEYILKYISPEDSEIQKELNSISS